MLGTLARPLRLRPTSAGQGACLSAGVRLDRLLYRRTYRLQPRLIERGADGSALDRIQPANFGGVIGGVQAGYNVRLPSGLLLGVEADLTFPNYLTSNSIVSLAHDRALRRHRAMGLCRHRARPHRLRHRTLAGLRHRRSRLGRRALPQHARDRRRGKAYQRPARLGRRRRPRIRLRAALERAARISLQPVRTRQHPLPFGHAIHLDARLPVAAHRPQPQGRLAGLAQLDAEDRPDRSGIRPLGNPRPDHLSAAGLSVVPRALYRHQQPDAGAAGAGDLEQQPVSERAALGGRRGLLQSRTAAGIWPERHRRRRRLSERRSAEIELPLPALQHLAAVPAPDLRLRRRAGRAGQRTAAARRQGRRLPADGAGRQVRRHRRVRRQRLCQGHPQGFHELVDVGAGRLRLFRRQGRPDLWRHRRIQSEAMGAARRLFPDAGGLELQQFRHQRVPSAARMSPSWRRATRCSRSRASCAPSPGSTAPIPAAIARR